MSLNELTVEDKADEVSQVGLTGENPNIVTTRESVVIVEFRDEVVWLNLEFTESTLGYDRYMRTCDKGISRFSRV